MKRTTLTSLGKAFTRQIHNKEAAYHELTRKGKQPEQGRAQWIGKEAEKAWFAQDLKRHCGTTTLRDDDPISAVSNIGNPRRTDAVASVGGEVVQFELKKSQYHSSRVANQLGAQLFDLGLGTYGASQLCVLYGEEGRIMVYSREDAKKAVDLALKENKPFERPAAKEVIDLFRKPASE